MCTERPWDTKGRTRRAGMGYVSSTWAMYVKSLGSAQSQQAPMAVLEYGHWKRQKQLGATGGRQLLVQLQSPLMSNPSQHLNDSYVQKPVASFPLENLDKMRGVRPRRTGQEVRMDSRRKCRTAPWGQRIGDTSKGKNKSGSHSLTDPVRSGKVARTVQRGTGQAEAQAGVGVIFRMTKKFSSLFLRIISTLWILWCWGWSPGSLA